MRWRVRGSLGHKQRTSVLVEAPDVETACSTAREMGLTIVGVELDEAVSVALIEPGAPLTVPIEELPPLLIERTGKRWKALLAASALLLALGLCGVAILVLDDPRVIGRWPIPMLASLGVAGLGAVGLFWAKLGAWWHHG